MQFHHLRVQSTPPTCCPRAIILPRSTKKHTHSISTKPFEAATCSDGLCVQLYNSITYSKKETNTMNFVFYTPIVVFSAQKKFISATIRLSPAESNSKGVFRRGLYHNVEFLSISTLKMTKVCQCACPSSIVSVSSLLYSVATCSLHFPFFTYVVIAVQYLRTSHGIHVHNCHKQSCCCAITGYSMD